MEISKNDLKTQNGPIREPEAQNILRDPLTIFAERFSDEMDKAVSAFLTEAVGEGWDKSKVSIMSSPFSVGDGHCYRYHIFYDGKYIGIMRSIIAVQETKAIGNIYFELVETEDNGETGRTKQKTV